MALPSPTTLGASLSHCHKNSHLRHSARDAGLLRTASIPHIRNACVLAKPEDELDMMMAEDMQQFTAKQPSKESSGARTSPEESSDGGFKETLDKVLIGDFFFILVALLWFVVGIGLQVGQVTTGPLDTWYFLWQPVFQPALGVLMLGALVSGLTGEKEE